MAAPVTIHDFNAVIQEIAIDLFRTINTIQIHGIEWSRACLDVRSPKEGGSRMIKFRIENSNGTTNASHVSGKVTALLRDAWFIKDQVFPDQWYGLKLILLPTGSCELLLNYDPSCASDPTFFES